MSSSGGLGGRAVRWFGPDVTLALWDFFSRLHGLALGVRLAWIDLLELGGLLPPIAAGGESWVAWRDRERGRIARVQAMATVHHLVDTLCEVTGYQVLRMAGGLFNADPHPGNIIVMPDGRLGLIDYGQCKRLTQEMRGKLARILLLVGDGASDAELARAFRDAGLITKKEDDSFAADFARLIFGRLQGKMMDRRWHHELHGRDKVTLFPPDLIMVVRTVGILRGIGLLNKRNVAVSERWRHFAEEHLATQPPAAAPK